MATKETSLQLQRILNIRKYDSLNSVQSSLKSHPLWVTLYLILNLKLQLSLSHCTYRQTLCSLIKSRFCHSFADLFFNTLH